MKKPISATIEENLISWIDKILKETNKYRNRSHIIEIAIEELKSREKKR